VLRDVAYVSQTTTTAEAKGGPQPYPISSHAVCNVQSRLFHRLRLIVACILQSFMGPLSRFFPEGSTAVTPDPANKQQPVDSVDLEHPPKIDEGQFRGSIIRTLFLFRTGTGGCGEERLLYYRISFPSHPRFDASDFKSSPASALPQTTSTHTDLLAIIRYGE
jgi:hypothetical protein